MSSLKASIDDIIERYNLPYITQRAVDSSASDPNASEAVYVIRTSQKGEPLYLNSPLQEITILPSRRAMKNSKIHNLKLTQDRLFSSSAHLSGYHSYMVVISQEGVLHSYWVPFEALEDILRYPLSFVENNESIEQKGANKRKGSKHDL